MGKTYIHYGNDHFDMKIFENDAAHPGDNSWKNKPPFGFWASPVGEEYYTWKQWCENEDYCTERLEKSFKFTITKKARILTVKSREDIFPYLISSDILERKILDFNSIMTSFDGMELIHGHDGKNFMDLHYNEFYAWDVDSIVIWNPYIIIPINKARKEAA